VQEGARILAVLPDAPQAIREPLLDGPGDFRMSPGFRERSAGATAILRQSYELTPFPAAL